MTAEEVIKKLNLIPLPEEGGYYRETYRSVDTVEQASLPGHSGDRCMATQIYYLLTPEEFSGLHRVKHSDEFFHFYLGDPVEMILITEEGNLEKRVLSSELGRHQLQSLVPKGVWQGTRLAEGGTWALLGCTVAPGFEFEDFEIATRKQFLEMFPQHDELVKRYTREA